MRFLPHRSRAIPHLVGLLLLGCLLPVTSLGWIYPEHRDITYMGIRKLSPERRAVLERLWTEARLGHEARLAEITADSTQGEKTKTIDYAAWPAISGDHSISGGNLLHNVLETEWILEVADIAAWLKNQTVASTTRAERMNHLRDSDIKLQRADPDYATRAGRNNV